MFSGGRKVGMFRGVSLELSFVDMMGYPPQANMEVYEATQ